MWLNSGASKSDRVPLTKCSITVAVTQQSWREGNHYSPLSKRSPYISGVKRLDGIQSEDVRSRTFPGMASCRHRRTSAHARVSFSNRETKSACRTRMIWLLRRHRMPKVEARGIHRSERDRVIFVRAGTFCASFRHAMRRPARSAPTPSAVHTQEKQCGAQFVADVPSAIRNEARAERLAAPAPFASPYCPYEAQNRRAQVQPLARFVVSPSM